MKKLGVIIPLMFLLGFFFVAQSFAAQEMGREQGQKAIRVSQFMNKEIKSENGEKLGKVEDVVIGNEGRATYVLLSGKSDKLHPVPAGLIRQGPEKNEYTAQITRDKLEKAPSISKQDLAQLDQPQWENRIFSYYGEGAPGQGSGQEMMPGMQKGTMPGGQQGMEHGANAPETTGNQ